MDQSTLESDISDIAETTKVLEKINKVKTEFGDPLASKANQEKVTQDNSTKIFVGSIESNTLETYAISPHATKIAVTIGDVVKPFMHLIESVTIVISEITVVYENVKYYKKTCISLMDRVEAAEKVTKTLKRRLTEEENFHNQEYYKSFIRFVDIIKQIKKFMVDVSNLNRYQKFLHSGSVKDRFGSLVKDFDEIMTELHSATESNTLKTSDIKSKSDFVKIAVTIRDVIKLFVPLIESVTIVISEIMTVYENVQYNKNICNSLMDRVDAAETAVKTFKRRLTETGNFQFHNQEYYKSFIRFVDIMKQIKNFITDVSNLNRYQKFLYSGSVKDGFDSLVKDFDVIMAELHFTMAVANEEQRRRDQCALESDIADMNKFLSKIGGGIIDQNQRINTVLHEVSLMREKLDHSDSSEDKNIKANQIKSTDLIDPLTSKATDRRGKNSRIIKKIYMKSEVACKPIDLQNGDPKEATKIKGQLAILGKLRDSLNIIRFYGLSNTENSDVMVFEWAEYGSLKELYCNYDIAWHVKVQIALEICRGLTFLHSCEILHHDIRCAHILMCTGLIPKIAKFNYSRMASGPTSDMKGVTDIMRWMAPEKLRDSVKHQVPYTFKCEIFSFGMLLWELVFEKIPYKKWDILKIKEHVLAGNREKITWGKAPPDVQKLQKGLAKTIVSAWQEDPTIRASLQNIFINLDHLANKYCTGKENIPKLLPNGELDLDGSRANPISDDEDHSHSTNGLVEIQQIISLEEGVATHRNGEHAKDTLETSAISPNATKITVPVGEVVKPFVPFIESVTIVISEIIVVYENVRYNKKICNSLMDRVNVAEAAIKTFKRRLSETENFQFHNQEYYKSFIRFVDIMKQIKNFITDVSNLNRYQKFLHSGSVKDGFDSLVKDFDVIMAELHFTMAVANEEQRRRDQCALESDIADMNKFLKYGSLKELYCNYDIAWHVKVQIALEICRGLTFLHSCEILHHDIRCAHILMCTGLIPKIAKFNYSRMASGPTSDMKGVTDIMRWMAPEKLRDSVKHQVPYTFKCEIFSFGMLLWELVFEKIPYKKWDILKIKEHVLAGNREKIKWGKAEPDVEKLQKDLAKIIVSAWQGDPTIRASLQNIFINLDHLANKYCTGKETAAKLLPDKELDLDGSSDEDHSDSANAHADLDNALAKYWKGIYLWEGIEVEKDRKQACELFKQAADDEIAEAQLNYTLSFVNNPLVNFDHEIFFKFITKAADNNNPTAQFHLAEVYLRGKLNKKKDEKLGKKYLRLAALNNQPKAKELLQKLGINVYTDV
ncbi:hypothetical protein Glove_185g28 [Diversispora epigaea]|uniref:Protein kinase domain-containing protein n=1 Tax=Diversispora epigaea TaxID=1348612 RepID=A0A397IMK3_9GLOM|nr:hypothetical protein Glove_185g28 [Diversispora epigaea]